MASAVVRKPPEAKVAPPALSGPFLWHFPISRRFCIAAAVKRTTSNAVDGRARASPNSLPNKDLKKSGHEPALVVGVAARCAVCFRCV